MLVPHVGDQTEREADEREDERDERGAAEDEQRPARQGVVVQGACDCGVRLDRERGERRLRERAHERRGIGRRKPDLVRARRAGQLRVQRGADRRAVGDERVAVHRRVARDRADHRTTSRSPWISTGSVPSGAAAAASFGVTSTGTRVSSVGCGARKRETSCGATT